MNNLKFYEMGREVPETAKKAIGGGRLKGMTDINPMWRIKKLTEIFGAVGQGWVAEPVSNQIIDADGGQKSCFVEIRLKYKDGDTWSDWVYGSGGSMFVSKERSGLYVNDECFKMANTDALGGVCKQLGIGANVYWDKDNTKYNDKKQANVSKQISKEEEKETNAWLAKEEELTALADKHDIERLNDVFGTKFGHPITEATIEELQQSIDSLKKKHE